MRILNLLIAALVLLVTTGATTTIDGQVAQLRLNHAALVAAENDFRARRVNGRLAGAEAADYAAYVARLQRRVIEDCGTGPFRGLSAGRPAMPGDIATDDPTGRH